MSLLKVAAMDKRERRELREFEEAAYRRVRAIIAAGTPRSEAWAKAAKQMKSERRQVIAAYWQHVRRTGADA